MTRNQRPLRFQVFSSLLAASLGAYLLNSSAVQAEPTTGKASSTVHVYPGAEPIVKNLDTKPTATTTQSAPHEGVKARQGATDPAADHPAGDHTAATDSANAGADQTDAATTATDAASAESAGEQPTFATAAPEADQQAQNALAEQEATQHYYLAQNYFQKWQLDLAEIEYDEAIKFSPDMKIAHRDMWLVSLCKFNLPRSFAEMIMVTGLADPVALNDQERADLDRRAMHVHYKKAISLVSDGKAWDEAITELQWALTYAPDSNAVHHSLAFVYASKGDFKLAEQEYAKTFALAPTDGVAHADFANLLADKGQAERAQEEMRKAVQLSPNAAALHVDLGWMAESRSDVGTATTEFQKAVQLSPNHAGLWAHLGRLLEKQGQVVDAQSAYSKAISLDPALTEAKESLDRLKQPQKQSGA